MRITDVMSFFSVFRFGGDPQTLGKYVLAVVKSHHAPPQMQDLEEFLHDR